MIAAGLGDKEIAQRLGISIHTVRTHLERVFREQQVRNRSEAAARALTEDVAAPEKREGRLYMRSAWALLLVLAVFITGALAGDTVAALSAAAGPGLSEKGVTLPVAAAPAGRQGLSPSSSPAGTTASAAPARPARPGATPSGRPASPSASGDPARAEAAEVNSVRAANGLPPLAWQSCLASVAGQNANRMAAQGFPSPSGGAPAAGACDPGATADEILVYWSSTDPGAVTQMLLADPLHRSQLLGEHRAIGVAWAVRGVVSYLAIELA